MVTYLRCALYRVPPRLRRPLVGFLVAGACFVSVMVWPVLLLVVPGVFVLAFVGGMLSAAVEIAGDRRRARRAARLPAEAAPL